MTPWLLQMLVANATPTPPIQTEMHTHFAVLTDIRDHLVQGRLAPAKAEAQHLVDLDPPVALPTAWRPLLAEVKAEAASLVAARDHAAAAAALGRVAVACAECHAAHEGGPTLEHTRDIPPQTFSEGQNMVLHAWAVDWMWLGLLGPDDEAWERGAASLDSMPIAPRFEGEVVGGKRELEQLVYVVASKARQTDDLAERGELFGALVGTCAQCHVTRSDQGQDR